jgi:MYXO-CTERM domain-containing protein
VHIPVSGCGVDAGAEDVVDVVDASPEDSGEDVADAIEVDVTDAAEDAAIDVAVDAPVDDVPADVTADTSADVTTADVADVVPPADAGADVATTDAAARDARGDVVEEGTGMPRGCACRAGQTGSSNGRAFAMLSILGAAIVSARRRRRQSDRQNEAS